MASAQADPYNIWTAFRYLRYELLHAYIFYSIYVIHGSTFLANVPNATGVLDAVNKMGGVPMFGRNLPIGQLLLSNLYVLIV